MKIITRSYGILISFLMTSCVVYYPQTTDIPLINKKKDIRLDGGISSMVSANATVSYGLTNNIAIQAYGDVLHGYYFHGAIGYYKDLGNRKVVELYNGFGYGYGNAYNDANPGHLYGDYQLYFTQFNYGKVDCKFANMDFGFGLKIGYLHSSMLDKNYYAFYSENGPFTTYNDNSLLLEPKVFIRLGGERLKFNLKVGSSWIYKFTNTEKYLPYSFLNLGLGLNYRF